MGISRKLSPDTGDTILHASCGRYGNLDITKYLVEEIKCDAGEYEKKTELFNCTL